MNRRRFRYALEPVLLTRRWALDALLLTLSEHNAQARALDTAGAALRERHLAARLAWREVAGAAGAQPVQRFAMNLRYLADLAEQQRAHALKMQSLAQARDEVASHVVRAQRALEAAEEHRANAEVQFVQQLRCADFKLADDQWNTLQKGAEGHGNQS